MNPELQVLEDPADRHAIACACGRALPLFSLKSGGEDAGGTGEAGGKAEGAGGRQVTVTFSAPDGTSVIGGIVGGISGASEVEYSGSAGVDLTAEDHADAGVAADAVRLAARLVDTPPEEMSPNGLVAECKAVVDRLSKDTEVMESGEVSFELIQGDELDRLGYGGIYGVGKGAKEPPALAIMSYTPRYRGAANDNDGMTMAWVGKGIVYDTGGLSLKISGGMVGMKSDMGGAAAVVAAFEAAAKLKTPYTLHALLCVAENAIGPDAFRNDDVLRMLSGKTVEINNSDAEGRLVLADGVNHASKLMNPDVIVDIATLTGAQMVR